MTLRFGSIGGDQIQISALLRSYPARAHRYSNFINETQFSKLHARPIRAPRAPARVSGRGRGRAWMARAGYALECGPHCSLVRGPIQEGGREGGRGRERAINRRRSCPSDQAWAWFTKSDEMLRFHLHPQSRGACRRHLCLAQPDTSESNSVPRRHECRVDLRLRRRRSGQIRWSNLQFPPSTVSSERVACMLARMLLAGD